MGGPENDVSADVSDVACRRILAAVLVEAVKSAQRGDDQAAGFLDEFGEWLGELLGFEMPDWRKAKRLQDVYAAITPEEFRERERQRFRELRERRKDDPVWKAKQRERSRLQRAKRKAKQAVAI